MSRRNAPNSARSCCKVAASSRCLGGEETSGPDVDGLRPALARAQKSTSDPTMGVQVTECKSLIARAEKRVAALDAHRAQRRRTSEVDTSRVSSVGSAPGCDAVSRCVFRGLENKKKTRQIRGPDKQDAPCMPRVKRRRRSGQGAWSNLCRAALHPSKVECMVGKVPCKGSRRPFRKRPCSCPRAHFQTFRRGGTHGGVHWRDDAVRTRMTNAGTGCAEFELARRLTQVAQPGDEEGSHRPAVVRIAKVSLRQTINERWTSHAR